MLWRDNNDRDLAYCGRHWHPALAATGQNGLGTDWLENLDTEAGEQRLRKGCKYENRNGI